VFLHPARMAELTVWLSTSHHSAWASGRLVMGEVGLFCAHPSCFRHPLLRVPAEEPPTGVSRCSHAAAEQSVGAAASKPSKQTACTRSMSTTQHAVPALTGACTVQVLPQLPEPLRGWFAGYWNFGNTTLANCMWPYQPL
jgi:hypothetical protein